MPHTFSHSYACLCAIKGTLPVPLKRHMPLNGQTVRPWWTIHSPQFSISMPFVQRAVSPTGSIATPSIAQYSIPNSKITWCGYKQTICFLAGKVRMIHGRNHRQRQSTSTTVSAWSSERWWCARRVDHFKSLLSVCFQMVSLVVKLSVRFNEVWAIR